jgi:hypothetical protein
VSGDWGDEREVRARSASELLSLPVRLHGIQLGVPVDALLDEAVDRVVGFEVHCGDGARRFLPFAVADLHEDEIAIRSVLTLMDEHGLDFYRRRARRLSDLPLARPCIDGDGRVHEALNAA